MVRIIVPGCLLGPIAVTTAAAEQPEIDEQAAMAAWTKASTPADFQEPFASRGRHLEDRQHDVDGAGTTSPAPPCR